MSKHKKGEAVVFTLAHNPNRWIVFYHNTAIALGFDSETAAKDYARLNPRV